MRPLDWASQYLGVPEGKLGKKDGSSTQNLLKNLIFWQNWSFPPFVSTFSPNGPPNIELLKSMQGTNKHIYEGTELNNSILIVFVKKIETYESRMQINSEEAKVGQSSNMRSQGSQTVYTIKQDA